MTQAELLKAYKKNGWIITKKEYAGRYLCEVDGTVFSIEDCANFEGKKGEWIIHAVDGYYYDEEDPYVTHRYGWVDAQNWLVNAFHGLRSE